MWTCAKCRETLEDNFDVCWSCGTSRDGIEDLTFRKAEDIAEFEPNVEALPPLAVADEEPAPAPTKGKPPLHCLRCRMTLRYVGTKAFHEGISWGGILGDWGEFFVNKESFDLYACPRCGHCEFFVTDIGAEFRPRDETA